MASDRFFDAPKLTRDFLAKPSLSAIFAPAGPTLSDDEKRLFSTCRPFGFILFQRNCESPQQVTDLVAELRALVEWDCPILIDQEGGRVRRLKEPNWQSIPSSRKVADLGGADGVKAQAQNLAAMLFDLDIDVNCMPVCDVPTDGVTDNIVGDRAYAQSPEKVAEYARLFIQESAKYGMTSIVKHMPGHGRAIIDSHDDVPFVNSPKEDLIERDFMPFIECVKEKGHAPLWGMIAHIIFEDIDDALPSSLSLTMIEDVIRGELGYEDQILVTDDINMGALKRFGTLEDVSLKSLESGMDFILHCSGKYDEMASLVACLPQMSEQGRARVIKWLDQRGVLSKKLVEPDFNVSYETLKQYL